MKSKIALFGGTFDPIHNGHIDIANAIMKECEIDKVVFVPAYKPPHKKSTNITNYNHRVRMVNCAVEGREGFIASTIESEIEGENTYTIDLINEIKKNNEKLELFFILGSDSLFDIEQWKSFEEILRQVTMICYSREVENDKLKSYIEKLELRYDANIILIGNVPIEISSTDVRARIRNGNESVRCFLAENVIEYIKENNLYE